jgi:hypothetical protein
MIQDPSALANLREEWLCVESLEATLRADAIAAFAMPTLDGHYPRALSNAAQNLLFLHACSVLDKTLRAHWLMKLISNAEVFFLAR